MKHSIKFYTDEEHDPEFVIKEIMNLLKHNGIKITFTKTEHWQHEFLAEADEPRFFYSLGFVKALIFHK